MVGRRSFGETTIINFIDQDAYIKILDTIGQDIASLSQRIIKEAGADGIYLSIKV